MSGGKTFRRVVTGLNEAGKSCILIDGPIPASAAVPGLVWHTPALPADNSATEETEPDASGFELMHGPGSLFMLIRYGPHSGGETFWHTTDTIDYIVILEGEVVFKTETGETTLKKGDFLVDRGINHAWRNDTDSETIAAGVLLPAGPVGKGRTV